MLSEEFLSELVESPAKRALLKDLTRKRCELVGVVGRNAFHIFDKTNRTWICSSKAHGYIRLFESSDNQE